MKTIRSFSHDYATQEIADMILEAIPDAMPEPTDNPHESDGCNHISLKVDGRRFKLVLQEEI